MTDARTRLALIAALAMGGLVGGAHTAHAEPVPPGQELYVASVSTLQNPSAKTVDSLTVGVAGADGSAPTVGTLLKLTAYSCGRLLQSRAATVKAGQRGTYVALSPSGSLETGDNPVSRRVGPSIQYVLTISQEGYDAYDRTGSYDGYNVPRPTCEEIQHPLKPSWSKKKARRTIVGRTISVTPTTAPGAAVTYLWRLRNRYGTVVGPRVGERRTLRLERSWVGRGLAVTIKVRKAGYRQQSRTLVFPKVRAR